MLDLNDLKMYEDKIRTKEEQKAKEKIQRSRLLACGTGQRFHSRREKPHRHIPRGNPAECQEVLPVLELDREERHFLDERVLAPGSE